MLSSDSESDYDDYFIIRRSRLFRERVNFNLRPFYEFNEKFRLKLHILTNLRDFIALYLQHQTNRNHGQYHGIADMHGVSKATVCRVIKKVVDVIHEKVAVNEIGWPRNITRVIEQFYAVTSLPNVVGCIDGTLVKISAPTPQFEDRFVDRHGNHSINVMLVCGPDLRFYYVCAKRRGKVHDASVLRNSVLYSKMENGWRPYPRSVLLSDSGYGCDEWLITPKLSNLNDVAVQRFNRVHKSTRRLIENAIGVLK